MTARDQEVADGPVKRLFPKQFRNQTLCIVRAPAADSEGDTRQHSRGQLQQKFRRTLIGDIQSDRVSFGGIFVRSCDSFRLIWVFDCDVMHLVTLVQTLQHLERANLPALCRRMQKVRVDPEDLHEAVQACSATCNSPSLMSRPSRITSPHTCRLTNRQMRSVASIWPLR